MANSVPPDRGEMVWTWMGWVPGDLSSSKPPPSGLARPGLLWPVGSPSQANQAAAVVVCNSRRSLSAACFPALPDRRLAQTRATCSEHSFDLECLRLPATAKLSLAPSLARTRSPKKDSFRVWRRAWMGCVRSGLAAAPRTGSHCQSRRPAAAGGASARRDSLGCSCAAPQRAMIDESAGHTPARLHLTPTRSCTCDPLALLAADDRTRESGEALAGFGLIESPISTDAFAPVVERLWAVGRDRAPSPD